MTPKDGPVYCTCTCGQQMGVVRDGVLIIRRKSNRKNHVLLVRLDKPEEIPINSG